MVFFTRIMAKLSVQRIVDGGTPLVVAELEVSHGEVKLARGEVHPRVLKRVQEAIEEGDSLHGLAVASSFQMTAADDDPAAYNLVWVKG